MAPQETSTLKVLEVCLVNPYSSSDSPEPSTAELSLPLTLFDLIWFKFAPVQRIFFFEVPGLTSASFTSVILPKLKNSLSLALLHFLPLTGKLIWPPDEAKPVLVCSKGDGLSITIAESTANFYHLVGNQTRDAAESHPYVPELASSESEVLPIALQVTFFPDQGFCIGVTSHHAILDGKTSTMFVKAWAHFCRSQTAEALPETLTPSFERGIFIRDPEGIDMAYLKYWLDLKYPGLDPNPRSLRPLKSLYDLANLVRGTFELSREDIKKLRNKVLCHLDKVKVQEESAKPVLHLSSFVLSLSYVIFCRVRAKKLGDDEKAHLIFMVDCRSRLNPPLPATYFGNCVHGGASMVMEVKQLAEENGLAFLAKKLGEAIHGLEKTYILDGAKEKLGIYIGNTSNPSVKEQISVAGSPRFEVYGTDFGWGRPRKVEITSIYRTEAISMAESRDGSDGLELGLVMNKHEMEAFHSLFVSEIKDV